jgi:hypothetical protein
MAKCLSWAAIALATMTVVLLLLGSRATPSEDQLAATLSLLAGVLSPIVALVGWLLSKRGGRRAPRVARVALAFGCGAFSWPLLLIVVFSSCPGGLC